LGNLGPRRNVARTRIDSISIEVWEKTFGAQTLPVGQNEFEALVLEAAERAGVQLGTSLEDTCDATEVVRDVLRASEVGTIGICFPHSTFGDDAIGVSINRFPGGTAVGLLHSTWEPDPSHNVCSHPKPRSMRSRLLPKTR
jgi:hypothetical protein